MSAESSPTKKRRKYGPGPLTAIKDLIVEGYLKREGGIPIPPPAEHIKRPPSETELFLQNLNVGDSFLLPMEMGATRMKSVLSGMRMVAKRLRIPLVSRMSPEGLRVWRPEGVYVPKEKPKHLK